MRQMIEEMVDENFDAEGPVRIGNLTFDRSTIVRELDPTAYREAMNDMVDCLIEDLQYDLERLDAEVDAEEIQEIQDRIDSLQNI